MKGCDKFCAFCIVPFTRGREVSRPAATTLSMRSNGSWPIKGTREIVLLGQTVNTYGQRKRDDQIPFHDLLAQRLRGRRHSNGSDSPRPIRLTSPMSRSPRFATCLSCAPICICPYSPAATVCSRPCVAATRGPQYLEVVDKLNADRTAGCAGHGHHCRISRGDGRRVRADAVACRTGSLPLGLLLCLQRARRHSSAGHRAKPCPYPSVSSDCGGCRRVQDEHHQGLSRRRWLGTRQTDHGRGPVEDRSELG